jgi:hypothetical protein
VLLVVLELLIKAMQAETHPQVRQEQAVVVEVVLMLLVLLVMEEMLALVVLEVLV